MERSQGARAGGSANSSAAQASATKKNSRSKASHPEGLLAAGKIINGGESRPAAALGPSKPIKPGHRSSTKSKENDATNKSEVKCDTAQTKSSANKKAHSSENKELSKDTPKQTADVSQKISKQNNNKEYQSTAAFKTTEKPPSSNFSGKLNPAEENRCGTRQKIPKPLPNPDDKSSMFRKPESNGTSQKSSLNQRDSSTGIRDDQQCRKKEHNNSSSVKNVLDSSTVLPLAVGAPRDMSTSSTQATEVALPEPPIKPPSPNEYEEDYWDDGMRLKLTRPTKPNHRAHRPRAAKIETEEDGENDYGLKVTMTEVAISETKQLLIQDTLEQITGQVFKLKEYHEYSDSGENLAKNYWMKDNQLRVYGVVRANDALTPKDITRRFAISTLESYGYHATYCEEALDAVDSDFSRAFELLYTQCFKLEPIERIEEWIAHGQELRTDEKKSLEAIYGDDGAFREVIRNRLWKIILHPGYINRDEDLQMEIRFPEVSQYPWEPPLISISVASLSRSACLNITRRLVEEAVQLSAHAEPFIFSLIHLLENVDEMSAAVKSPPLPHSLPVPLERPKISFEDPFGGQQRKKINRRANHDVTPEIIKRNQGLKTKFRSKSINSKYVEMQSYRKGLPAWDFQPTVLSTIEKFPVVIVQGMTGCGKSTQVPQYLLDEFLKSETIEHRSLICTQPRRISATAVAGRIADERAEELGEVVGYQIRLEGAISNSTRLLFCTTGILLQRLESDTTLKSVTHIIIDEVHERSEESDFLLLICRDLLKTRPDLRVILMSATIDSNLFSDYFGGAPVITIPGRIFPVEKLFLEDILEKVDYEHDEGSKNWRPPSKLAERLAEKGGDNLPPADDSASDVDLVPCQLAHRYPRSSPKTRSALASMDYGSINYDLIHSIILWILNHGEPRDEGAILVFLPGMAEISIMLDRLERHIETSPSSGKCILLPLHSSLSSEEQSEIFVKPKPGMRKIIVATNLAETSITIDDCVFVIDSGQMKICRYDPNKEMKSLDTVWISVANALQRSGRAGRVRPGTSFHLYTSHRFRHQLCKQPPPEIDLVSLERSIMRCKTLPIFSGQSASSVLEKLPEPPHPECVGESLNRLQHLGAMDSQGELTPLGRHLAILPVDLRVGKLMIFGAMFRCVDSALTMAACLSYKSPFTAPWKKRPEAQSKKLQWSTAQSDHLTVLKAFKAWQEARKISERAGRLFAEQNFLSVNTLEMLCSLKQQYVEQLSSIGFLPVGLSRSIFKRTRDPTDRVLALTGPKLNENGENYPLLLSVLCASFYPLIVRVLRPDHRYNKSGSGAVLAVPHPTELKFMTRNREVVRIHPSSVLFSKGTYDSPYVVFHEKMKTSQVFILECSMVPAFPLILCGGSEIHVQLHGGRFVIELDDGWIKFVCDSQQVAELLAALRNQLDALLMEKIHNPQLDLCNDGKSNALLSTISKLMINPTSD